VAGRGKISEPITTETSKLDWRCFEYYKLIGMNSTFAQILGKLIKNKMSENLKNFENLKEKKGQNSALCSTH
jgi:hypothetical protein